ncbi:MAG: hypothetical protein GX576_05415 [Thauera phenolivorans]|uniref:Uncharacterized protein n=1 Tax=Thauera phenolivorans TaxID=1792543 RepID=A0A7X7LV90_9RHOO|nr:hypothetical protein [Thauera phenolivorans]NLF53827.1 hypothetical protein [Thauera phenolivorans]
MLSITDLRDFIELDHETVAAVHRATGLSDAGAVTLTRQFLASRHGILTLHHMFRDQIAEAVRRSDFEREHELRRAYGYFARKYPLPELG